MATKTIGTGGNYSTLALYASYVNALGTLTAPEVGQVLNQELDVGSTITGTVGSLNCVVIFSGFTPDATNTWTLTAAPGASFRDNSNATKNPLRYSGSNGSAIKSAVGYGWGVIGVTVPYATISNLQILANAEGTPLVISATNFEIDNCILQTNATTTSYRYVGWSQGGGATFKNCLIVANGPGAVGLQLQYSNIVDNCTIVAPSNALNGKDGIFAAYGTTTLTNTIIAGFTGGISGGSWTGNNNATDLSSLPAGLTSSQLSLSMATEFMNPSNDTSAMDWRLKNTSVKCRDNGTNTGVPTTDIIGQAIYNTTRDIGAWEYNPPTIPIVVTTAMGFPGAAFKQSISADTQTVTNALYPGAVQPLEPSTIVTPASSFPGTAFTQHGGNGKDLAYNYLNAGAVQLALASSAPSSLTITATQLTPAFSQSGTIALLDQINVAQQVDPFTTSGTITGASTRTLSTAQVVDPFTQTATLQEILQASAAQNVDVFTQTVNTKALANASAAQNVSVFTQTANTSAPAGVSATQHVDPFTQTANTHALAASSSAQNVDVFTQSGTIAVHEALSAIQTIPDFTSSGALLDVATSSTAQQVPAFTSSGTLVEIDTVHVAQIVDPFTASSQTGVIAKASTTQSIPDFIQSATLSDISGFVALQTIPDFTQSTHANAPVASHTAQNVDVFTQSGKIINPEHLSTAQLIPDFTQSIAVIAPEHITASQQIPDFSQSAIIGGKDSFTATQQIPDFNQAFAAGATATAHAIQNVDPFTTTINALRLVSINTIDQMDVFSQIADSTVILNSNTASTMAAFFASSNVHPVPIITRVNPFNVVVEKEFGITAVKEANFILAKIANEIDAIIVGRVY